MKQYLQKGDVIELKAGRTVYDAGGRLTKLTADAEYAVVSTGSTGQGSGYDGEGIYPDGYKVVCRALSDQTEIYFYQSGCFSAIIMPSEIRPVRKINID
jgi:hypothetical protein